LHQKGEDVFAAVEADIDDGSAKVEVGDQRKVVTYGKNIDIF
jgi:hypothetical protein